MSSSLGLLPSTDWSGGGVPVGTTSSSTSSGASVSHPVSFRRDSSIRTSTGSVILSSVSSTSRVGATTCAVAIFLAVAALDLGPVLGLGAILREVALVITISAGDIFLLFLSSAWIKQFLRSRLTMLMGSGHSRPVWPGCLQLRQRNTRSSVQSTALWPSFWQLRQVSAGYELSC